jgi:metal-responsive CopG/Arc/MetJ family transcriptional regulator
MASKKPTQMVHLRFDQEILEQLDDFRFQHRFETRSDAIRWLLSWALSRKPDPKKQDK